MVRLRVKILSGFEFSGLCDLSLVLGLQAPGLLRALSPATLVVQALGLLLRANEEVLGFGFHWGQGASGVVCHDFPVECS